MGDGGLGDGPLVLLRGGLEATAQKFDWPDTSESIKIWETGRLKGGPEATAQKFDRQQPGF